MSIDTEIHELHFDGAPHVETPLPGPKSTRLIQRQRGLESDAISYPKQLPIALRAGNGATIEDVDGNRFIDFFAGIGVLNVGHSNPYVTAGAKEQLDTLVQTLDFPSEVRLNLLEKLNEIAPGTLSDENRVVFGGPTGSNAVDASLKLVREHTGKQGMIGFRGGYHGSTFGALSISANNKRKKNIEPLVPGAAFVPYPSGPNRDGPSVDEVVADVRELVEDPYSGHPNIGGVWVEPIQGEGGVVVPPDDFLPRLRELTRELEILLIVDEIQTGFGRTGEWFATDWVDVTPDVLPMAKALGGIGLPLSAMMFHETFDTWGTGGHVGTYRGILPSMIAGTRAIEYTQHHELLDHARDVGSEMRARFREIKKDIPQIVDVRGRGLFTGVEFVEDDGTPADDLVQEIQTECANRGILVWKAGRYNNVIRLIPPLVITPQQVEIGLNTLETVIGEVA